MENVVTLTEHLELQAQFHALQLAYLKQQRELNALQEQAVSNELRAVTEKINQAKATNTVGDK
jgi:hypothetical protein